MEEQPGAPTACIRRVGNHVAPLDQPLQLVAGRRRDLVQCRRRLEAIQQDVAQERAPAVVAIDRPNGDEPLALLENDVCPGTKRGRPRDHDHQVGLVGERAEGIKQRFRTGNVVNLLQAVDEQGHPLRRTPSHLPHDTQRKGLRCALQICGRVVVPRREDGAFVEGAEEWLRKVDPKGVGSQRGHQPRHAEQELVGGQASHILPTVEGDETGDTIAEHRSRARQLGALPDARRAANKHRAPRTHPLRDLSADAVRTGDVGIRVDDRAVRREFLPIERHSCVAFEARIPRGGDRRRREYRAIGAERVMAPGRGLQSGVAIHTGSLMPREYRLGETTCGHE